jgi:succinyl-diaminopimelate desuccinylase
MITEQIAEKVRKAEAEIVGVCRDFTRIPSENPPGDTTEAFAYAADLLRKWGYEPRVIEAAPRRQNLIVAWDSGRPGRHLVFNGHLDVFPAGSRNSWAYDPFGGHVDGGRLYGRGTTDMKAGVTASLFAFRYLREFERRLTGRATLTLVCDEENFGPYGARHLVGNFPEVIGDALINGEPSTPSIMRIGDKGLVWAEASFRTRGGHAAYAHVSENAIHQAMRFLDEVKAIETWKSPLPAWLARHLAGVGRTMDRALGKGATAVARRYVVSLGMISGGIKVNMIPSECRVEIDARIPIGGNVERVVAALRKAATKYGADFTLLNSTEPSVTTWDHPIFQIGKRVLERVAGEKTVFAVGLGCNDARLWRYEGVPGLIYGPTPHNMGAADEYVEIEDLLRTAMVHAATAAEYLAGAQTGA